MENDLEIAIYAALLRGYVKRTEAGRSPADVYLMLLLEVPRTRRTAHVLVAALLEAGASHNHVARAYKNSF